LIWVRAGIDGMGKERAGIVDMERETQGHIVGFEGAEMVGEVEIDIVVGVELGDEEEVRIDELTVEVAVHRPGLEDREAGLVGVGNCSAVCEAKVVEEGRMLVACKEIGFATEVGQVEAVDMFARWALSAWVVERGMEEAGDMLVHSA
jgi:hypothetical protein